MWWVFFFFRIFWVDLLTWIKCKVFYIPHLVRRTKGLPILPNVIGFHNSNLGRSSGRWLINVINGNLIDCNRPMYLQPDQSSSPFLSLLRLTYTWTWYKLHWSSVASSVKKIFVLKIESEELVSSGLMFFSLLAMATSCIQMFCFALYCYNSFFCFITLFETEWQMSY